MVLPHVKNTDDSEMNVVELKNNYQKRKIIKNLFLHGAMTNTELGKFVKLSTPKIISLLNELKDEGIVEELGQGNSSGGRRPNLYGNKEDAFFIIGISINLYHTTVTVFNAKNQRIIEDQVLTLSISSGIGNIDPIVEFTENVILEKGIRREKILGIGVEMPGMVDSATGINKTHMVSDIPVAKIFEEKFGLNVIIENDAKARAFAELRFGLAHSKKNVLAIQLDWGIGLGIIVNGKLYKGRDGFAGEFGHLPMVDNGSLCRCGKRGCLETVASGTAIALLAKEGIETGQSSFLSQLADYDSNEIKKVIRAANLGDQYSITMLANVGQWLGKGLAYLIQIFNPEMIILGGPIAEAKPYIFPPIQQSIQAFCIPDLVKEIQIKVSELGSQAGILGVAALFLEHEFDKN